MTATDKAEISFATLSLEPIEDKGVRIATAQPALAHANTRSKTKTDRRVVADRREMIRFQEDRRSGKARRPKKSWDTVEKL